MSIDCIKRIRDCGVFRDFNWPPDLAEFGRYNLIYGWNWSGKTTLSKLFRALEAKAPLTLGQVTFCMDGRDVGGHQFAQESVAVRVFNRDFVEESVFPMERDVAPIFIVGKESVEKQKRVDQLKASLAEAQRKLASDRQKTSTAESALDNFCIDRARAIKDTLRSSGSNPYNNYNKSDFSDRAQQMASADDRQTQVLSDAGRETLLAQQRAAPKEKLEPLAYRLPALKPLAALVQRLLSTTVVSGSIESLKDDPFLSSWVHQGVGLQKKREATKCLFCNQAMPKDRLAALEAHFSAEYEQLLKNLDDEVEAIETLSKAVADLVLPNDAEFYEDLSSEYKAAQVSLRQECCSAKRVLDALAESLREKKSRVFERVAMNVAAPDLDSGAVDGVNEVIRKHNQACAAFASRIAKARQQLEAGFVADDLEQFVKLSDSVNTSKSAVGGATAEVTRLNSDISPLEREIVEHRQPAEQLNDDLRSYLGHDELRLEIKETGYTIMRRDTPAEALSEGERTAIALLYFLKSLQDRRFELTKGVVVLDDPVSSLDANALYSAFGFIRERTQDAAQLIILTHNFAFFRQVRNWYHHLKGQNKKDISQRPARFYMLECTCEHAERCASMRWLDPLLEQFESEYHHLFAYVYRFATVSPQSHLEENYVLPNVARRLLEAFLAFKQPQMSGDLWQKMQKLQFDENKKFRILRFLHTHWHGSDVGEPEHDLSLLSEAQPILNDLLKLMESEDAGHFSAMQSLVTASEVE